MSKSKLSPEQEVAVQIATDLKLNDQQEKEFIEHVLEIDSATLYENTPTLLPEPTDPLIIRALNQYMDALYKLYSDTERATSVVHPPVRKPQGEQR